MGIGYPGVTGESWLDWAALAVSLFNTILQVWLGLTVILNAERRTWGIWLAGGGLLLGGLFFTAHTIALVSGLASLGTAFGVWWLAGWISAVLLPFAWYVVLLWYCGFWEQQGGDLRRRQRPWLILASFLAVGILLLAVLASPAIGGRIRSGLEIGWVPGAPGLPLVVLTYPVFILLCSSLTLGALRHPAPSGRWMGEVARRRARPWLVATSMILLTAGLMASAAITRFALDLQRIGSLAGVLQKLEWFDLLVATTIALAVWTLGQAIVSYEVFTGRSLPRRGLARYWQRALILAGGYSLLMSASLVLDWTPVYILLLSTLLLTVFYALLSWRTYRESERIMANLRPFLAGESLFNQLLDEPRQAAQGNEAALPVEFDIYPAFAALCSQVLGAERGILVPMGALAPLAGSPFFYPASTSAGLPDLGELDLGGISPAGMGLPLDPQQTNGLVWVVPLWSERGLTGLFLLGNRRGDGLYSQEEIEIARAAGERLMDLRATGEMARRLLSLQRQSLVQSQLGDQRIRRALHDEMLPRLHTALLALSSSAYKQEQPIQDTLDGLSGLHREVSELLRSTPPAVPPELGRLGLVGALQKTVGGELSSAFERVDWEVQPEAEQALVSVPGYVVEVLYFAAREAARNAARYGRIDQAEKGLHLQISLRWQEGLELEVADDGAGLPAASGENPDRVGSGEGGQGLALHSALMAVVGGSLELRSLPGQYTRVLLRLPGSLWQTFIVSQ